MKWNEMDAPAITFPAEFWQNKIPFCFWLFTGLVYTKTIMIRLSVAYLTTAIYL